MYVLGKTQRPSPMDMDAHGGAGIIDALPGDIFVDVLRRLRAHSLARCRCVCTLWRAVVDGRGLLLPHALPPRSFPGFFATVVRAAANRMWRPHPNPGFLPPPASRAPAVDRLAFLRPHLPCSGADAAVQDQCNGLVLCFQDYLVGTPVAGFVCNPTTERWARLPPPPTWWPRGHEGMFLAFDPAVSLEYEVLLLPVPPPRRCRSSDAGLPADGEAPSRLGQVTLGMFMPESFQGRRQPGQEKALPLLVFSSAHGRWTRRMLAPGRCAPDRLYDRVMRRRRLTADGDSWVRTWRSALYRRGALYAHCEKRILVVLRCPEGTYDMVKLPDDEGEHVSSPGLPVDSIFASTAEDDGVLLRYASVDVFRVKVWALQESSDGGGGQLEWTLTHDKDLAAHARMLDLLHHAPSNRVPLAAEEGRGGGGRGKSVWFADEDAEEVGRGDVGDGCSASGQWNWDDASLLDMEIGEDEALDVGAGEDEALDVGAGAPAPFSILGCHPSKEVVFLVAAGAFHVVAYHLGGGKVHYMGRIVSLGDGDRVEAAMPYRPCTVDALPSYTCPFPSLDDANKTRRSDRSRC